MKKETVFGIDVRMGRVIPVKNVIQKPSEDLFYFSIKLEDETGEDEWYAQYTQEEMFRTCYDLSSQVADEMKFGRLYKCDIRTSDGELKYNSPRFLVKLRRHDRDRNNVTTQVDFVMLVSNTWINKGKHRHNKQPENAAKTSWLVDKLD